MCIVTRYAHNMQSTLQETTTRKGFSLRDLENRRSPGKSEIGLLGSPGNQNSKRFLRFMTISVSRETRKPPNVYIKKREESQPEAALDRLWL